jgi:cytochrome P450
MPSSTLEYKGEEYSITNQMILCCVQATHYDPQHFPDPSRFFPDRFLDTYEPKAHRFAWRPFERGSRTCMGQEMAMESMRIVLLLTARWFDFEPLIQDKGENSGVLFTELNNVLGDQAFGQVKISAGARRGAPMRVKRTDRAWM